MSKILWKSLLLSPAVLGATIVVSSTAHAVEQPQSAELNQQDAAPATDYVVATVENNLEQNNTTVNAIQPQVEAEPVVQAPSVLRQASVAMPMTVAQATAPATAPAAPSPSIESFESLDELNRYSNEGRGNANSVAQVTSVSQLSDVQPTDWAFQALQSLVERYGVIAGYPDGTYRGNRAMTRYEFAAGLNAALDRVNELIAAGTADMVRREDLATLQRLQEEFAAELATLRGRVDALEAQTAELEANQFSTTTKLVGEVVAAISDTFGDDVDDNTVFQNRVRLDFQSSFGGSDILHTRLSAGNAQLFSFSAFNGAAPNATFEGQQTFNVSPNFENSVAVDWLAYDFPLFGQARGYLAATGGVHADYAATANPYFEDYDGGRGALSTFAQQNPIYRIGGGAGGGLTLAFGGSGVLRPSSLTVGYLADNASDPGLSAGIGNGDYAALAQLNFNLGDRVALAATYVHGYHTTGNGIFDIGGSFGNQSAGPVVGTTQANLVDVSGDGFVDGVPGLAVGPTVTNSYGVSAAFRLSDRISISGFGTYTNATLLGRGGADIWTFGGGVAFPDLGKEGNLLGIFAGVEPTLRGVDAPGVVGFNRDYGLHVEGFYRYQLTDNVSITPGVIWLSSPGQNNDNSDVIIGTLRTTFNF
jgi:BMFP domain-containing protein YqiC